MNQGPTSNSSSAGLTGWFDEHPVYFGLAAFAFTLALVGIVMFCVITLST